MTGLMSDEAMVEVVGEVREKKHRGRLLRVSTCLAALACLFVGHSDREAVVWSTGRSVWRGVAAQGVGDHSSGG